MTAHEPPQIVEAAFMCSGCNYDLRGLDPAGRCPECGHDIADSRRRDEQLRADPYGFAATTPRWRGRFGTGLRLMLIAMAPHLLLPLTWHIPWFRDLRESGAPLFTCIQLVGITCLSLMAWGALLTLSARPMPSRFWRWLRALAALAIISCVAIVIMLQAALLLRQFNGWVTMLPVYSSLSIAASALTWLYWSRLLESLGQPLPKMAWTMVILSIVGGSAVAIGPYLDVGPAHAYGTTNHPVVGSADALLIAVRSFVYRPRIDVQLSLFVLAGAVPFAATAAMLLTLKRMKTIGWSCRRFVDRPQLQAEH